MALRILPQLLAGEAEIGPRRILELLRHLIRDVVVGREADLVLAVRLELPGRHLELDAVAGRGGGERLDGDRRRRRQARAEQRGRPRDGAGLRRTAVDPEPDQLELVLAERRQPVRHRCTRHIDVRGQLRGVGRRRELQPEEAPALVAGLHARQGAGGRRHLEEVPVGLARGEVEVPLLGPLPWHA